MNGAVHDPTPLMASSHPTDPSPHGRHTFPPTMWSMVRLAVAEGRPGADQALDELCRVYEKPILAYIIRNGHSPETAEDLKQSFFEHLLARNSLADAETTRVKLRAFLITKLQSFLVDEHRHATAQKRGGGKVVALSSISEEQRHLAEPVDHLTPDRVYQQQWVQTLLQSTMRQLEAEYVESGKAELFALLSPLIGKDSEASYAELAVSLGKNINTLKSDVHRLRKAWKTIIEQQVAATLDDPTPANIKTELGELMAFR